MRTKYEIVRVENPKAPAKGKHKTKYDSLILHMKRLRLGDYIIVNTNVEALNTKSRIASINTSLKRRLTADQRAKYRVTFMKTQNQDNPEKYDIILKKIG